MPNKFTSRKIFKVIIICLLSLILIVWNPQNIFGGAKGFFFMVTSPVEKSFSSLANKVSFAGETFTSIGKIKKENEFLIEENLTLKTERVNLKDANNENEILRNQLNILPREKFDLESASIIGRNIYNNTDWVMINKGSRDGIEKGMSVIVSDGVLVGKVDEVFNSTSKVIFITNSSININVETLETGAAGTVRGNYGLGLVMDLVLQTDHLNVGDDVITSDISQNITRGLLVGKIKEVYPANNDLFQKAILVSPVDFFKLRFVFVIKNVHNQ
jgi:rod shape-determining protein MreC